MGQFFYKAVNQSGAHVAGTIEAADRRSAVVSLADKGQFVTELAEKAKGPAIERGGKPGVRTDA